MNGAWRVQVGIVGLISPKEQVPKSLTGVLGAFGGRKGMAIGDMFSTILVEDQSTGLLKIKTAVDLVKQIGALTSKDCEPHRDGSQTPNEGE